MVRRLCGILLLALAVSPVTAPFSTCDLTALVGGQAPGAPLLQPKPAPDDPVPGVGSGPTLNVPRGATHLQDHRRVERRPGNPADHRQLRV